MKISELLKFSFLNLWRRKSRTILTVLGVMIGAASIVVMMSIGIGLNQSFIDSMESSSSLTMISIYYYPYEKTGSDMILDSEAIDTFSALDHVVCASPIYSFSVFAKTGKYEGYININAVSRDMLLEMNLPILKGALPEEGEGIKLIVGKECGYNFYNPNESDYYSYYDENGNRTPPPVDLYETSVFAIYDMDAYYQSLNGEGEIPKKYVLESCALMGTESEGYSQYDYSTYADIAAVEKEFGKIFKNRAWPNQRTDENGRPIKPMSYDQAVVYVDDIENVSKVQQIIADMGFECHSEIEYLEMMKKESRTIQYVLGGIGSVSLLVAAIGITNTMLMSIYERTKEIGIYKVLGCSIGNIRAMFLSEAGMIGFGGGILGLGLSYGLSYVINLIANQRISLIPFWLALLGLGFSVAVGMLAGITPALRAVRLSPLEAIRTL